MALAFNRKALHEYEVIDKYKAGIVLFGHEVKAVREGRVDFGDSYVKFLSNKPVILNLHIGPYSKQGDIIGSHEERRTRGLLLNKKEVEQLLSKVKEKGLSIVPLQLINDHGLIKLEIALAKGKKNIDKKRSLKEKQQERDLKREEKEYKKVSGDDRL